MGIYSSNNGDDDSPLGLHAELPDPDPALVARTQELLSESDQSSQYDFKGPPGGFPPTTSISMHVPTWLIEETDRMIEKGLSPYRKKQES